MAADEYILPAHIIAAAGIVTNEKGEILMVKDNRSGWVFPGGQMEVGENLIDGVKREVMEETGVDIQVGKVCCISSNTSKSPGYNGVKEVPTKLILDFICTAQGGTPRPSEENSESRYFSPEQVLSLITSPPFAERFQAYLEYAGQPTYLEFVTYPAFKLKLKRLI